MLLRRVVFGWLFPAAFVLPVWLFIGWIVFSGGSGWALLWLIVSAPAVFVSELILALLIRVRASVRDARAVSWRDVIGVTLWHLVVIGLGFYDSRIFFPLLVLSVVGVFAVVGSSLVQLWNEARGAVTVRHATDGTAYIPAPSTAPSAAGSREIIVVSEKPAAD